MRIHWSLVAALQILCIGEFCLAAPSFQEVKTKFASSEGVLLDRHGVILNESRVDLKGRRLQWVELNEISPHVVDLLLKLEDRRFYEHGGVDVRAIASSLWDYAAHRKVRGASTLTMQLASILDSHLHPQKGLRRSFWLKLSQMREALNIEKSWTKSQILEAYLNLVTFKGELQGIESGSQAYFGKSPHGLTQEESLLLVAGVKLPSADFSKHLERACLLVEELKLPYSCDEIKSFSPPSSSLIVDRAHDAPHVAIQLLKNGRSLIKTTLDKDIQRFAFQGLQEQIRRLRSQNVQDGAVLVIENKTGNVLAYVGSGLELSSAKYVDGVRALRQAGSTLKPFIYELAFEKKYITAESLLDDSALEINVGSGIYHPQNYDNSFHGPVAARTALASSLNVPAVKTLMLVGVEQAVQRLRSLGFDDLQDAEFYGPSLALGSADVSLWQLVNAYRTLANKGIKGELRLSEEKGFGAKTRPHPVMENQATFIISDILSDRQSRSLTFGLESVLSGHSWMAAKTGTSKDMRDNWCVGYSDLYTVGVWVGNFSGDSMWDVSGTSGAAPLWAEIMDKLTDKHLSRPPQVPKGVIKASVKLADKSVVSDWFIAGTEPYNRETKDVVEGRPKITYPVEGSIFALDPDIPEEYERIPFEATSFSKKASWVLDGHPLAETQNGFGWKPKIGSHTLALIDGDSSPVDQIKFYVKSGGSRPN